MNSLHHSLFFVKPTRILMFVHSHPEPFISTISKGINCDTAHLLKVVSVLEQKGLLITWRDGSTRQVRLTDRGRDVTKTLIKVWGVIDGCGTYPRT